jgi:hypothetical protein
MRLEHIPIILGVIVALVGTGFIADAVMAESTSPTADRRRRMRAERHRLGEGLIGLGTLCMAAALFGRDTWRYGTLSVLAGGVLLLIGFVLNRGFLKEAVMNRGAARRADGPLAPRSRPRGQSIRDHATGEREVPLGSRAQPAADTTTPHPALAEDPPGTPDIPSITERRKTPRK